MGRGAGDQTFPPPDAVSRTDLSAPALLGFSVTGAAQARPGADAQ